MKNRLNVYRINREGSGAGWLLSKSINGKYYQEWFGDKSSGGAKKALEYAEATRDLLTELTKSK